MSDHRQEAIERGYQSTLCGDGSYGAPRVGVERIINASGLLDRITELEAEVERLHKNIDPVTLEGRIVAAYQRIEQLEGALREIENELGVPTENYPAPVANAVGIARRVARADIESPDKPRPS